jgi:hypothetical protein
LGFWHFLIGHTGQPFYDFAPWRRLLIRDNQLALGAFVKVIVLGLALCNDSEPKKKGETKRQDSKSYLAS